MNVFFLLVAAVAVVSTVLVVTGRNAVHALLYLIVSLLSVAVVFASLGAPFVAVLEVIIYAGAIMVLFIFVVMMLNLGGESERQEREWLRGEVWVGPGLLAALLAASVLGGLSRGGATTAGTVEMIGPSAVGVSLFGRYLIGAELAGFLLLAGLVGAYHIGRRDRRRDKGEPS